MPDELVNITITPPNINSAAAQELDTQNENLNAISGSSPEESLSQTTEIIIANSVEEKRQQLYLPD